MFRDLRTQLLLWTILPLAIILVGVAYLGVNSHQNSMRDLVKERDSAMAREIAARLSEALTNRAAVLQSLDPTRPESWNVQRTMFDGGIASFDNTGTVLNAMPSSQVWQTRHVIVQDLIAQRITFSTPVSENGAARVLVVRQSDDEILVGAFTLPPFGNVGIGARGVAYLVDARGKIIAHPEPSRIGDDMSQHEGIAEVIRGESGATFHHAGDGSELVVGYTPIALTSWGLMVEEPWADAIDPMFQYSVLLPLVLALAAIVALGVIYFGVRNVHQPLQRLAQAANRIAYGDYHAAETQVGGIHEIEELRETLDSMARQVSAAQNAMQNYITAMTRGQEDERMRLARELHDDTIQSLIALQQRIEMVEKALARDPRLALAKLDELKQLLTDTLTSVRRFVRDLRPTYLNELGLIPALEMLTREAPAGFEVVGEEKRLDAERELALYRIVQESLRNIIKHAHAKSVSVTLSFDEHEVTATIQDDGIGFAAPEVPTAYARAGHFGLMGMQERAQLFGGNVYVKSERGKGTKVVAYVPVSATIALHPETSV
ncbi:two-component system, NarL family, nitrate/nitrite sensor histidine kinase NarX [Anaerolineae bacterium]|nr:two-component system, NarL family, nitrate/nitrite sensor histidine kinase NarX [Anaerolineae bacterium]